MACRKLIILIFVCIWISASASDVRSAEPFRLSAPQDLIDSGFLKYLLPRFSLKTNTRIELVSPKDPAEVRFLDEDGGTPVFEGLDRTWYASVEQETSGTIRFMTGLRAMSAGGPLMVFRRRMGLRLSLQPPSQRKLTMD